MVKLIDRFNAMVRGDGPGAPVGRLIGFRPTAIETGKATFELEAGPQHANPMGTLHGGIICDVADAAMGTAYASALDEGESFTTLKTGRTIGLVECDVTDPDERPVARAPLRFGGWFVFAERVSGYNGRWQRRDPCPLRRR